MPNVTGIGPQLKRNGTSKVCVYGPDLAAGDKVSITDNRSTWEGTVNANALRRSGGLYYASVRVQRVRELDYDKAVADRDLVDDDLGALLVTVTRGVDVSPQINDGGVVDP